MTKTGWRFFVGLEPQVLMDSLVAMPRDDGRLDSPPPAPPPGQASSLMAMASTSAGAGNGMSNPVVIAMGKLKKSITDLQDLAVALPGMSSGIQQVIAGLETAGAENIAAMMDGSPIGPAPGIG